MDPETSFGTTNYEEKPKLKFTTCGVIVNLVVHTVIVGVTGYVAYHNCNAEKPMYSTHVTLMLIAVSDVS
jgi:hypothetical protein